jgi:hypothetical protein
MHLNRYFAATDFGVYESVDAGLNWQLYGSGLPNVVVTDLAYQAPTRTLVAGTYGRSIFAIDLDFVPTIVVPDKLTIIRGNQVAGNLISVAESDDQYLAFTPGVTLNPSEPPVWIELSATSPMSNPNSMIFAIETRASTANIRQSIELFNFDSGMYEEVDARMTSLTDSIAEYVVDGDPTRFIEADSNRVRARIGWKAIGIVSMFPWTINIDRCTWTVAE